MLRNRVSFQSRTASRDSTYGDNNPTWATQFTRWASALPVRGDERWESAQEVARSLVKFRVRSDSSTETVTPEWRILHDGEYYGIRWINDIRGMGREIEFVAEHQMLPDEY